MVGRRWCVIQHNKRKLTMETRWKRRAIWDMSLLSSCLTVSYFLNELPWTTSLSHSYTQTVLIINCDFPAKEKHLLEIEMSNAAVEQCYYRARKKCDIQLSFPVLCLAHIALLNQVIQAGTRGTLFSLTPETRCCYSRRSRAESYCSIFSI